MDYWITIGRIALEALAAKTTGKAFDYAAASVSIIAAGRAAYQAEVGEPLDESKIPPYTPLP